MSNSGSGESLTSTETVAPLATPTVETQRTNAVPNRNMSVAAGTSTAQDPNEVNDQDDRYDY